MNARFWTWHSGGWVKVTVRPGQSLSVRQAGPTDEGWFHAGSRWTHEGDRVHCEQFEESQDCDGRHSWYGSSECRLDDLRFNDMTCDDQPENDGIFAPLWVKTGCGQRDYSAEAMNY